ncbi:hypothetical protein AYI70_g3940, partial [Smittium culicis]
MYIPLLIKDQFTEIRQMKLQPTFYESIQKLAEKSRLFYDSSNITSIGWTERNLNFINTLKLENNDISCNNCITNENDELTSLEIPGFGKCVGGFCEYQDSGCYFNIAQNYWWKCIPEGVIFSKTKKYKKLINKKDENNGCAISSIEDFSVTSFPYTKRYDFNNPIHLTTDDSDFEFLFNIDTQDDINFLFTDINCCSSTDSVLEISINFNEGLTTINEGPNQLLSSFNDVAPQAEKSFKGKIRIVYSSSEIKIYVNNVLKISYTVNTTLIRNLYITPLKRTAVFSDLSLACLNSSSSNSPDESSTSSSLEPSTSSSLEPSTLSSLEPSTLPSVESEIFSLLTQPTSSVKLSITSPINMCESVQKIGKFSISSSSTKVYDYDKPIFIPCSESGFNIDLDVETQDDIFFLFKNKNGNDSEDNVEIRFNFGNKMIEIFKGSDLLVIMRDEVVATSSKAFRGKISFYLQDTFLNIYINGLPQISETFADVSISSIYITPLSGKAEISNVNLRCEVVMNCPAPESSKINVSGILVDPCNYIKSISDFSVVSAPRLDMYSKNNPISIPCNDSGFLLDMIVDTQDDLYFLLKNKNKDGSPAEDIEISIKFGDTSYEISEGLNVLAFKYDKYIPLDSKAFKGRITIGFYENYINVNVNDVEKIKTNFENRWVSSIYATTLSGKADISDVSLKCIDNTGCSAPIMDSSTYKFPSSTVPLTTPSATSSAATYIVCEKTSSFNILAVTSSPYVKMYDLSSPILVPCTTPDFILEFDIDSESDMYVAITDMIGFTSTSGYTESSFEFESDNYSIKRFQKHSDKKSTTTTTKSRYSGHLTIKFISGTLSLWNNNEFQVRYNVKNLDLKKVFISAYTGTAKISNGYFTCIYHFYGRYDIRKPVKRARTLFSDVLKGNGPQYLKNEVNSGYAADYPRVNNQHRLNHYPRSQLNNKKMQKSSAKKTLAGKKVNLTDMSMHKEVSIKHILFGGEMTCLKKFCTGGSDMKVGCTWAQFKGNHTDALEVIFSVLKDMSYIRQDDHRASTTYMIFNSIKDANNLMSTKLVYNDKPIDLYQTVKIEEDITVVNIPNFRDVGIEPMAKLILKELWPWCEIKDISAWRR